MKGALQVLRRDMKLDESKKEVMDELLAQIVRLENLVRDLLTFARPNPLSLQPVDLHVILDRSLRLMQDGIEEVDRVTAHLTARYDLSAPINVADERDGSLLDRVSHIN